VAVACNCAAIRDYALLLRLRVFRRGELSWEAFHDGFEHGGEAGQRFSSGGGFEEPGLRGVEINERLVRFVLARREVDGSHVALADQLRFQEVENEVLGFVERCGTAASGTRL
jgi:hypothetical protein